MSTGEAIYEGSDNNRPTDVSSRFIGRITVAQAEKVRARKVEYARIAETQARIDAERADALKISGFLLETIVPLVASIAKTNDIDEQVRLGNGEVGWQLKRSWHSTQESYDTGVSVGRDGLMRSVTTYFDVYDGVVMTAQANMYLYNIKLKSPTVNVRDNKTPKLAYISRADLTKIQPTPHIELADNWTQLVSDFVVAHDMTQEVATRLQAPIIADSGS